MALHYTPTTPAVNDLTLHLQLADLPASEHTELRGTFFPAEWYPQCFVQLTWPHDATDWATLLPAVDDCYISITLEILTHGERVLVVTPEPERIRTLLSRRLPARLLPQVDYFTCPTNDTWARDHAFLTLIGEDGPQLLDFQFNGWGMKFPADLDNQICRRMRAAFQLPASNFKSHLDFVFEGGSIESDGGGTLLTTRECLLSANRNPALTAQEIETFLLDVLHSKRLLWLEHGFLAGDDTDSHIDTLARFCPGDTIAYVQCTDPSDEHYDALAAMEEELRCFRPLPGSPREGEGYRLIPLPLPSPIFDPDDGHRLPATYANFLVINGAVLMPTYGQPANDQLARSQLQKAFPRYDIVPIDCRTLIRQHGSLHCSTMQYPVGVRGMKDSV